MGDVYLYLTNVYCSWVSIELWLKQSTADFQRNYELWHSYTYIPSDNIFRFIYDRIKFKPARGSQPNTHKFLNKPENPYFIVMVAAKTWDDKYLFYARVKLLFDKIIKWKKGRWELKWVSSILFNQNFALIIYFNLVKIWAEVWTKLSPQTYMCTHRYITIYISNLMG